MIVLDLDEGNIAVAKSILKERTSFSLESYNASSSIFSTKIPIFSVLHESCNRVCHCNKHLIELAKNESSLLLNFIKFFSVRYIYLRMTKHIFIKVDHSQKT